MGVSGKAVACWEVVVRIGGEGLVWRVTEVEVDMGWIMDVGQTPHNSHSDRDTHTPLHLHVFTTYNTNTNTTTAIASPLLATQQWRAHITRLSRYSCIHHS